MTKIGVLGSGVVAQALAIGFKKHGYDVMIGSRGAGKLSEWLAVEGAGITAGDFAQTAQHGEILVLAVLGTAAESVLDLAGAANLSGKVVIDACNPLDDTPPVNGVLSFFTGPNDSLMERLQKHVPAARFVKAFSCVGSAFMVNPKFTGGRPTMFICGNNPAAKTDVVRILDQFGWDAEDVGMVEGARAIEPLCRLWCAPGFLRNDWAHTFKMLRP